MVIIRGKVDPGRAKGRANGRIGTFRSLLGWGRWSMEYTVKDNDGNRVDGGTFKADPNGCFAVSLNAPIPGAVEVKVKGGAADADDRCTVDIFADNDIINLPRNLNPR